MRRYSAELIDFITKNVKGRTTQDLVALVNSAYGTDFTEKKMQSFKKNHDLKSGVPSGRAAGEPTSAYPADVKKYIEENHRGVGHKRMAELLNERFGRDYTAENIKSYYANHKLNSGLDGRFRKGNKPVNTGQKGHCAPGCEKGWFKKGNVPCNHRPVGSERIDNKDGYALVKIAEPNVWEMKHKVLWESHFGKVPSGHVVTFLDGNKQNIALSNLTLITMAESCVLSRLGLRSQEPEFTQTGILIAKIKIAQRKRKKAKHDWRVGNADV